MIRHRHLRDCLQIREEEGVGEEAVGSWDPPASVQTSPE